MINIKILMDIYILNIVINKHLEIILNIYFDNIILYIIIIFYFHYLRLSSSYSS